MGAQVSIKGPLFYTQGLDLESNISGLFNNKNTSTTVAINKLSFFFLPLSAWNIYKDMFVNFVNKSCSAVVNPHLKLYFL